MADRFYINCPLKPGAVVVEGPEAHHLAVVCRVRPGDRVCLFNGDGHEYPAEVVSAARRSVVVRVLAVETPLREVGFRLEVATPLPKGDRGQFLVEKLTELGVATFSLLRTRRSLVHPRELERFQRYVIEASKQCGRTVLMGIEPLSEWVSYCGRGVLPGLKLLAHPGGMPLPRPEGKDVALAVGPEGGFTDEEVELALAHGWLTVGLGPRTLRIETAALALASWAACGRVD